MCIIMHYKRMQTNLITEQDFCFFNPQGELYGVRPNTLWDFFISAVKQIIMTHFLHDLKDQLSCWNKMVVFETKKHARNCKSTRLFKELWLIIQQLSYTHQQCF